MNDHRSAWKKAGFKKNPNRNAGIFWFCTPGTKDWRRAFTPAEGRERLLWIAACIRVQRVAVRNGDAGLIWFSGQLGYGCYLFKLA